MTSAEVRAIVESEIGAIWSQSNSHGIDLKKCIVLPRTVNCRNTLPKLNKGNPPELWIVLEKHPGRRDGDLIVFDEDRRRFGLADLSDVTPVFLGFHGTFMNTLLGM